MKDIQPINVFSRCHLEFFEAVANNDLQFICANSSLLAMLTTAPWWMEDGCLLILTLTVNSYNNHKLPCYLVKEGWDNKLYALEGVLQNFKTIMQLEY